MSPRGRILVFSRHLTGLPTSATPEPQASFEPCDLEALLAPPPSNDAGSAWAKHMPPLPGVKPEILANQEYMIRWRHDIHAHPELGFEEQRTSDLVAKLMAAWGIEVTTQAMGVPTAVIGTLRGKTQSEKSIGLRSDLDALPMQDHNSGTYKSKCDGVHHGCGHDGHTAMLLGAAKYLAATRNFSGTVHFIFQPNEEGTGEFVGPRIEYPDGSSGAEVMVARGLFDKYPCDQIYGMHNWPALQVGTVGVKAGALMGSEDNFIITVTGKGGHGAMPNLCVDPVLIASHIVTALQSIVSRVSDPVDSLVVSVTQFNAGSAFNVTPNTAELRGTVRTFDPVTRKLAQQRLKDIAEGTARSHGASAAVELMIAYPPTINDKASAKLAAEIAAKVVGEANVVEPKPTVASEDFSYMLQKRRGCYLWLGNRGSEHCTANLHQGAYDFNDDALPIGASIFAALVEELQPL